MKQKEAICRRCGKPIWLIECASNGKWVSCDKELRSFTPGDGPCTYVIGDGEIIKGYSSLYGKTMYGYRKHRKDCDKK